MRLSKQMKKILLLLSKEGVSWFEDTPLGCLFEFEILRNLEDVSVFTPDGFVKGKKPYTPSKRTSYYRSFRSLIDLGLIEMAWENIDVKEWDKIPSIEAPRTRRFKFFALTNKGMKEAKRIRKQLSEMISEFQNLL